MVFVLVPFKIMVTLYFVVYRRWVLLMLTICVSFLANLKTAYVYPILSIFVIRSLFNRVRLLKEFVRFVKNLSKDKKGLIIEL